MNSKIEFLGIWVLSAVAFLTRDDIMFYSSVIASITITIKNMPDVCRFFKNLKKK